MGCMVGNLQRTWSEQGQHILFMKVGISMYYHHFHISVQFNASDENIDNMVRCKSVTTVSDEWRFYAESAETEDGETYFSAHFEAFAPSFEAVPGTTLLRVYVCDSSMYKFMAENFSHIETSDTNERIDFDLTHWEFSIRNHQYQLVTRNSDEL